MNFKSLFKMFLVAIVLGTSSISATCFPSYEDQQSTGKYYYRSNECKCKKRMSKKAKAAIATGLIVAAAVGADLGYAHSQKGGYENSFTVVYGKKGLEFSKPYVKKAQSHAKEYYGKAKTLVTKFIEYFKPNQG